MGKIYRFEPEAERRGGWNRIGEKPLTTKEIYKRGREKFNVQRLRNIAVLDFETDPFSDDSDETIYPFAACLYSEHFTQIVIWNNDPNRFVNELLAALSALTEPYTIYAHNGGKFDFMFLISRLRGKVSFKGRGIMSAKLGIHELRDSFHIIPERLANYKKDKFDYQTLLKKNRDKHRKKIIDYMVNDCIYLLDIVRGFVNEFGLKISIGQAAMAELKKEYKYGKLGEVTDGRLRAYFYGGRVECLAGRGYFKGDYKLYDVNSMYPHAMARFKHPVSSSYEWRMSGGIRPKTCFIDLTCSNEGALVKRGENNETSANVEHGRFLTTVYEFKAAVELGLIADIKIHHYIDNMELTDFSKFVLPRYAARQETKRQLEDMENSGSMATPLYFETKKQDIFLKLLLNNAYGKFAQNPRRFKESYITNDGEMPPSGYEDQLQPAFRNSVYNIWEKPAPIRSFNNVGTAASITGAARSILMRAIHNAVDPIYCDTDSLICKELHNTPISSTELGSWKLEKSFDEVVIAGKKLYACKTYGKDGQGEQIKLRSKGVASGAKCFVNGEAAGVLDFDKLLRIVNTDIDLIVRAKAPTLMKTGKQFYMRRTIKATAPVSIRHSYLTTSRTLLTTSKGD